MTAIQAKKPADYYQPAPTPDDMDEAAFAHLMGAIRNLGPAYMLRAANELKFRLADMARQTERVEGEVANAAF